MKNCQRITPHINNGGVFRDSKACNLLQLSCALTVEQHAPRHYSYAETVIGNFIRKPKRINNTDN